MRGVLTPEASEQSEKKFQGGNAGQLSTVRSTGARRLQGACLIEKRLVCGLHLLPMEFSLVAPATHCQLLCNQSLMSPKAGNIACLCIPVAWHRAWKLVHTGGETDEQVDGWRDG